MPLTVQQAIDALREPDWYWSGSTITFSIPGAGASWTGYAPTKEPFDPAYGVLSTAQANAFRAALAVWDGLIAPNFQEVSDSTPGAIRVAFTNMDNFSAGSAAYGYYPPYRGGQPPAVSGDVWIDDSYKTQDMGPGQYGFELMLHELGHALGLKHPFEGTNTLQADWDNRRYTIMSYTNPTDSLFRSFTASGNSVQAAGEYVNPQTPMLLDVIAIQSRYGADLTTAHGNDTYSFSATQPFMLTIYDSGGTDLIDLSNLTRGSNLNLAQGAYSSIDYFSVADQQAYWRAQFDPFFATFINNWLAHDDTYTWSNNLCIAPGTVIEQVRGSVGADTVTAADTAASVWGGAGNDVIVGGAASDYLRGEDGNDSLVGGDAFDDIQGNMGNDTEHGGLGGDWVVGGKDDDLLYGDEGGDVLNGNLGNDTIDGGVGADIVRGGQGDDVITAGDGDDWISGDRGNDTITAGLGADTFHAMAGEGIDRILDFHLAEGDRVQVDPGLSWTVRQSGADTIVDLGNGDQTVLVGVQMSTLPGGWIFVG